VLVPNDQKFWDDLIENKTKTGMFCYEQDWLNAEMDKSRTLGESATMVNMTQHCTVQCKRLCMPPVPALNQVSM
jgi:hypothetical protein